MNTNRYPNQPDHFESTVTDKRGGSPRPHLVFAVLIVGMVMVLFALLYKQPLMRVIPNQIMPLETQNLYCSFAVSAMRDEELIASGFLLIRQSRVIALASASFYSDGQKWVCTGKPPQSDRPDDTVIPFAFFQDALLLGKGEPASSINAALNNSGFDIEQINSPTNALSLRIQLPLSGLDRNRTYFAGILLGETLSSLRSFGGISWINGETNYTLTATDTLSDINRPLFIVAYFYSLTDNAVIIADRMQLLPGELESSQSTPAPYPSPAPDIATPMPASTVKPTNAVTPSPVLPTPARTIPYAMSYTSITPSPASTAVLPNVTVQSSLDSAQNDPQITPTHAYFHLFDIQTRYYYYQLTDREKMIFSAIYDGMMEFKSNITFPECTEQELTRAIFVVLYDCPELYQVSQSYMQYYRAPDEFYSIAPEYLMNKAQYETIMKQFLQVVSQMQNASDFGDTDLSRELSIYRSILQMSSYSLNQPYCDRTYGPLLYGYGKCDGYSKALSFSLRFYGIPCAEVCGDTLEPDSVTQATEHGWNYVMIDRQWYQCDITWDDGASGDDLLKADLLPFFNLTDERMLYSRTIWPEFLEWELPACISTQAFYYSDHGVIINQGGYFVGLLDQALMEAYQNHTDSIPLVFAHEEDYQNAINSIETEAKRWQMQNVRLKEFSYLSSDEGMLIYLYNIKFYD